MTATAVVKDRASSIQATLASIEELYKSRRAFGAAEWLEIDLTMAQLKVLFFLYAEGPTRVTDVATSLGVTLPTVTTLLDRLEERRLARRKGSPTDRRVVLCGLTQAGSRLASELWQVSRERFRSLLEALSPEDLDQVAQAMRVLLRAARKERKSAPRGG